MAAGLYTPVLDALDADRLLRVETGPLLRARAAGQTPPTNQQVLDAARASYHAHVDVVDSCTTGGVSYVQSPSGTGNVRALNAYDWASKQAQPIAPTSLAVQDSSQMADGKSAADSDQAVASLAFGITESAQVIIGEGAGVGVAFDLANPSNLVGTGYVCGKLGLDVDVSVNLNVGIWSALPQNLAVTFYGLEINIDLEVGVCLGIYVSGDLETFGFSVGVGAGLGGGATIVGGYTWVF